MLTSPHNPLLKAVRKARQQGGLTPDGLCLAESFHLVEEVLQAGCEVRALLAAEWAVNRVRSRLPHAPAPILVARALFEGLATTEASQGVLALVQPPTWRVGDLFGDRTLLAVLDALQDPGNVGTVLRSAEAFGATGVALLSGTASPFNPKALRASAGSAFRLPLVTGLRPEDLLDGLRRRGIRLLAAMPHEGPPLWDLDWSVPTALVVGSEGAGVRAALRSHAAPVRIPTAGVESLNAALAASLLLYEAHRQRTRA